MPQTVYIFSRIGRLERGVVIYYKIKVQDVVFSNYYYYFFLPQIYFKLNHIYQNVLKCICLCLFWIAFIKHKVLASSPLWSHQGHQQPATWKKTEYKADCDGSSRETFSSIFGCRMDENYNLLPHGVNFQDAIFLDTTENRRTFSSLFQFSNCSQGSQPFHTFSPEWDTQEDSRVGIFVWAPLLQKHIRFAKYQMDVCVRITHNPD